MAKHIIILFIGLLLIFTADKSSAGDTKRQTSLSSRTANTEKPSAQAINNNNAGKVRIYRKQVERSNKKLSENTKNKNKQDTPVKYRNIDPKVSAKSHMFEIYDAYAYLNIDYDHDGYYSDFTIEFDADTVYGHADVYAKLYLSAAGGAWVHYHTTDMFSIHGSDDSDDYSVTTRLKFDYVTADYDVLIDLYEVGYDGIIATIGPDEDANLYALPLEDTEHELGNDNTIITAVSTELFTDLDHDDFYTELKIEYDIDTLTPGVNVYSEIILTHTTELWQYIIETETFDLHNQTEIIDIELGSDFDPAWYDIEIKVIDSYSRDTTLAIAAQDFSSLTSLPLESIEYDDLKDHPNDDQPYIDGSHDAISNEGGGGSLGIIYLLLVIGLLIRKRFIHK